MTQTSIDERRMLRDFVADKTCLAEIGVFQGVTTRLLASVMDPYVGGRLGVDFNFWIAQREAKQEARGRIEWVCRTGADAPSDPRLTGKTVDYLFIDGDH